MTNTQITLKSSELINLMSDVFNGITQMKYTHPALDKVFINLGLVSTLETANAFTLKA